MSLYCVLMLTKFFDVLEIINRLDLTDSDTSFTVTKETSSGIGSNTHK